MQKGTRIRKREMELREKKKKKRSYKKREEKMEEMLCLCERRAKENRLVGAVGQLISKILFLVERVPNFSFSKRPSFASLNFGFPNFKH